MTQKLTVSSIFTKVKFGKNTINPKLTISGKWFKNAGFSKGDQIQLHILNNQIIIQKI